jgi:hypothetical protein
MAKGRILQVKQSEITIISQQNTDYISLTDMTVTFREGSGLISKWITNKNTIEYLGVWERINNPNFNYPEYGVIGQEAGTNRFIMSVGQWVARTNAIGMLVKAGRYGGTYAHKDIAFHFAMWLSPEFQIYLVNEFQRLKDEENNRLKLEWSLQRTLVILNLQFNPLQMGESELIISDFLYNTYSITDIQNGTVTIIGKYGDIDANDYVQAYDAALALQYSVGLDPLPLTDPLPWENWRVIIGNVDGVGDITANDASLILQHSASIISTFPVEGAKSLEEPIAEITITQDNDELVFTSSGDLYGLNIYSTNGTFVTMNTPTVLDQNMLSVFNINETNYNVGLCTAYSPSDNTEILRIPLECTDNEELIFNMIVNKSAITKSFTVDCSLLGISESIEEKLNVYPNPANDKIEIEGLQAGQIEIINLQGQIIKKINLTDEKTTIDISELSVGLYSIRIKTADGIIVKKLIKQ